MNIENLLNEANKLSPLSIGEKTRLNMINRRHCSGQIQLGDYDCEFLKYLVSIKETIQKRKECIERQIKALEAEGESYTRYQHVVIVLEKLILKTVTGCFEMRQSASDSSKSLLKELYLKSRSLTEAISECAKLILENISLDFLEDCRECKDEATSEKLFEYKDFLLSWIISFTGLHTLNNIDPDEWEKLCDEMNIFICC